MPNQPNSKRIALSAPPELNKILEDLSELQGIPKTKVILSLLEEMQPQLIAFRDALKAVKEGRNPNKILAGMFADSFTELGEFLKGEDAND